MDPLTVVISAEYRRHHIYDELPATFSPASLISTLQFRGSGLRPRHDWISTTPSQLSQSTRPRIQAVHSAPSPPPMDVDQDLIIALIQAQGDSPQCYLCQSTDHRVFQCPRISSWTARERQIIRRALDGPPGTSKSSTGNGTTKPRVSFTRAASRVHTLTAADTDDTAISPTSVIAAVTESTVPADSLPSSDTPFDEESPTDSPVASSAPDFH